VIKVVRKIRNVRDPASQESVGTMVAIAQQVKPSILSDLRGCAIGNATESGYVLREDRWNGNRI